MGEPVWGSMLATYRSCGACWNGFGAVCWQPTCLMGRFGAVCWQPTGLMRCVGTGLGQYVGNLQVLWGVLERDWGSMLATYRTRGAWLRHFGGVCWQPTGLN